MPTQSLYPASRPSLDTQFPRVSCPAVPSGCQGPVRVSSPGASRGQGKPRDPRPWELCRDLSEHVMYPLTVYPKFSYLSLILPWGWCQEKNEEECWESERKVSSHIQFSTLSLDSDCSLPPRPGSSTLSPPLPKIQSCCQDLRFSPRICLRLCK